MLPLALGLIKYVPDLVGLFGDGEGSKAEKIAKTVADVAQAVTLRLLGLP